jgi:Ser/Thr protein kinase RdoA (MazF antagonist)
VSAALDEQLARAVGLLRPGNAGAADVVERLGNADAWLLRHGSDLLLLKRGRPEQDEADVVWEHDHLRRLEATGFPASVPIPAFDGRSWAQIDGRIWAALTYLPGRPLASEPAPDMEAAGAFLARYHRASRQVSTHQQRPTAAGLLRLREVTPWDTLRAALGSPDALDLFAGLLEDLEAGLRAIGYATLEHLVIHGDPTNDNLIVDGSPSRVVGLIDFGAASLAPWPADIAAGLWRSGRAVETDIDYNLERITRFVRGYRRESPIPPSLAAAIPLLIQARGLALISRRVRRFGPVLPDGIPDHLAITLARTAWAYDHRPDLSAAIDAALHADA